MFPRFVQSRVEAALADTPVVLVNGPRQSGKSTLVRMLADAAGVSYRTLDNATTLAAATDDPEGFVSALSPAVALDEIQKAPRLFPAIKQAVDADRRGGRFLVTGSANVLLLPSLADSLAGRMQIVSLLPLSQGELRGRRERFVEWAFGEEGPPDIPEDAGAPGLADIVLAGGYPEVLTRPEADRRQAWHDSYLTAVLQRDVRDLANIQGLGDMPRLLTLLAARTGSLLNVSDVARSCGLPLSTLQRYLTLLETVFLFSPLPAWFVNIEKRLTKAPKVHLVDTGLAGFLMGIDADRVRRDPAAFGHLLEGFVLSEIRKHLSWSRVAAKPYHFRTASGQEVDIVLESRDGRVVGVEVKNSATVGPRDFHGLSALSDACGERFVRGIVLYRGRDVVPFGRFWAMPVEALWQIREAV
ncbi:MAG: ATP-binding protein [Betaproteobacteria bacterium]|nr:ATP-binding protein [Betaproteobacteria bacterium]